MSLAIRTIKMRRLVGPSKILIKRKVASVLVFAILKLFSFWYEHFYPFRAFFSGRDAPPAPAFILLFRYRYLGAFYTSRKVPTRQTASLYRSMLYRDFPQAPCKMFHCSYSSGPCRTDCRAVFLIFFLCEILAYFYSLILWFFCQELFLNTGRT